MKEDDFVKNNLRGIQEEKRGNTEKAIKLYEKNIRNNFDGSHPYKRLAIIYRRKKKFEDEIRVLNKAIEVFRRLVSPERQDRDVKLDYFKDRLLKAKKYRSKS
jgi:tetratricopeptide (TPR) repeat protein